MRSAFYMNDREIVWYSIRREGLVVKVIVVIQARMGSLRLPGKILKPLGNCENLKYVVERCAKIYGVSQVIIATSSLPQDDIVEKWCMNNDVVYYRGSEDDVLDRYIQVANLYQPDYIMRVTADCPFVDYEMASEMVKLMHKEQVDIVDIVGDLPRGLATELISYRALQYINEHGHEAHHREHVTYYAYEFKDEFTRAEYTSSSSLQHPQLRITLDTEADYALISAVAQHFNDIFVSSSEVVQYLLDHPEVAQLNAHIEQKLVV